MGKFELGSFDKENLFLSLYLVDLMNSLTHFLSLLKQSGLNYKKNQERKKRFVTVGDILIGPWMGEVGPELQYWIPFLNGIARSGFFKNRRVITISRGGVQSWYQQISSEYIELFDYIDLKEFKEIRSKAIKRNKVQKQIKFTSEEKKLIKSISNNLGIESYFTIHPSAMWDEVIPWLLEQIPINRFTSQFDYQLLNSEEIYYKKRVDKMKLPYSFIAVNFYSNQLFPYSIQNQSFINNLIFQLSKRHKIVYLSNYSQIDEHDPFEIKSFKNIYHVGRETKIKENLGVQSEIIRRAKLYIGNSGGFSILPAFLNVPCISFYSHCSEKYFEIFSQHEKITQRIFYQLKGEYTMVNTKNWEHLNTILFKNDN